MTTYQISDKTCFPKVGLFYRNVSTIAHSREELQFNLKFYMMPSGILNVTIVCCKPYIYITDYQINYS